MSTAKTQSQTPHLQRFSGEWETKRLQDILDINPQNFSSNTNPAYKFNYISLEQVDSGRLLGYAEEVFQTAPSRAQRILQSGDVLMSTVRPNLMAHLFFHDQVPNAVCSTGFAVLRSKHDLSAPYFIFAQLFSQNVNNQIAKILAGSNYPAINSRDVKLIEIPCPPQICEQRAIAEVLSDVDGLIGALDALIAKKRAIKQATMQQLLTGRIRLPGFSGEWETKQIGDVVSLCSEKNNLGTDIPVLTCSKHLGFVDSLSYFKNQVFSKDLSSYKIIRRGQIGYPINHVEEGSIGLQDLYDVALVSPIYVVCSPKEGINSFFLHRLLKLDSYRQQFANATTSSINRRGSLRWPAFSKIRVALPPIDEQVVIAAVLSDMETEIATLEQRRDKTRDIKQGMMQQLLTGRVRLVRPDVGPQCDYTIKS